jgi:hypothetical protein
MHARTVTVTPVKLAELKTICAMAESPEAANGADNTAHPPQGAAPAEPAEPAAPPEPAVAPLEPAAPPFVVAPAEPAEPAAPPLPALAPAEPAAPPFVVAPAAPPEPALPPFVVAPAAPPEPALPPLPALAPSEPAVPPLVVAPPEPAVPPLVVAPPEPLELTLPLVPDADAPPKPVSPAEAPPEPAKVLALSSPPLLEQLGRKAPSEMSVMRATVELDLFVRSMTDLCALESDPGVRARADPSTKSLRDQCAAYQNQKRYSQPVVGTAAQLAAGVTVLLAMHCRYCLYVGPMPPGSNVVVFASNCGLLPSDQDQAT